MTTQERLGQRDSEHPSLRGRPARSRALVVAAALGTLLAGLRPAPAVARQPADSSDPPKLVLGTVSADPGTSASVPLFLQPAASRAIRSVRLGVEFRSAHVRFVGARKGPASSSQDFDLVVEASELASDSNDRKADGARLTIQASIVDPDPKKALPEGFMASLEFEVPTDVPTGSVRLVPVDVSAQDGTDDPVNVIVEEGMIIVSGPVPACLFYMH